MKRVSVEIGGQPMQVGYEVIDGKLWLHANGITWDVELKREKKRAGSKHAVVGTGDLRAPMPGKILKILVKEGQDVAMAQVIVAMEAMKMEYSLKSQVKGRVSKVFCREGQQVALDELLVQIEGGAS